MTFDTLYYCNYLLSILQLCCYFSLQAQNYLEDNVKVSKWDFVYLSPLYFSLYHFMFRNVTCTDLNVVDIFIVP